MHDRRLLLVAHSQQRRHLVSQDMLLVSDLIGRQSCPTTCYSHTSAPFLQGLCLPYAHAQVLWILLHRASTLLALSLA